MPQIAIEYSANLADRLDPRALAQRIHGLLSAIVDTDRANCKTRLVRHDAVLIGDGGAEQAILHVDLRILSGRDEEAKRRLGEAVLEAAEAALGELEGFEVQLTVEVRELDRANYHKHRLPRR